MPKRVKGFHNRLKIFVLHPLLGLRPWMTVPWKGRWEGKLPNNWSGAEPILDWLYMIDVKIQEIFWGEEGETITQQFRESDSWWVSTFIRHFSPDPYDHLEEDDQ